MNDGSVVLMFEQAVSALDQGYVDQGMDILQAILDHSNAPLRVQLSSVLRRAQEFRMNPALQGSLPTAISELTHAIAILMNRNTVIPPLSPNSSISLSALSVKNAAYDIKKFLTSALFERAQCFWKIRKAELCVADLNEILLTNPEHFKARMLRGDVFASLNEFKNALDDYDVAVNLRVNDSEAYLRRAQMKLALLKRLTSGGGFDNGPKEVIVSIIMDLRKCLFGASKDFTAISDDDRIESTVELARCYMHHTLREFVKCAEVSTSAIKLLKKANLRAFSSQRELTDMERELIAFVSRHEENLIKLLCLRAEALFEQRKFSEAILDFNEVHQIVANADHEKDTYKFVEIELIQLKRAMCLAQMNQFQDAISEVIPFLDWMKHCRISHNDLMAKALDILGTCVYKTGKIEDGKKILQEACTVNPARPDLQRKLKKMNEACFAKFQKLKQQQDEEDEKKLRETPSAILFQELQDLLIPLADHLSFNNVKLPEDMDQIDQIISDIDSRLDAFGSGVVV
eukprot:TRINITY_DN14442_c0_g1_i1.p1 TRINITY_DN14442_c0_g1~~TRINITY_DN14442_c0_g1_i1.p1  ORF type:complete len:516 (+),score=133.78 TRINITY_DN14442_c0_g1_i1:198-1745(+)